jgi:hypothetical protein
MNVVAQAMETNTPSKERRDSSASHVSENSDESPFMTLVDAAASLLETKKSKSPKSKQVQAKVLNTKMNNNVNMTLAPETSSTTMGHENKSQAPATGAPETPSTMGHEKKVQAPKNSIPQIVKGTKEDLVIDGGRKQSFAEHLMTVLNDEANSDVLSWMPDGKAFTITNHKKFTMNFMPKLFNIRNMSSFVRKLCRWGFQRVHEKETRNSDIFKHPFFVRGDPALVKKCKCVGRVTGSGGTTTITTPNASTGGSPVTPPTLARGTFQPESHFVYESMPAPQQRQRRIPPPSMQQQQQHHHQHQHHNQQQRQQLPPASPPRNTHHYTHARNHYTTSNTSDHNIMNQHSMSSMVHRRMYNLQGPHSPNLHNVHSQVVSAALEALRRDNGTRSSYRNSNFSNSNSIGNVSNNHVNANNGCLRVPPQDVRRVTMPHKAVPHANDLSYNQNNNSSSRLMPVLLKLSSHPNVGGNAGGSGVGGSARGSGGRRNVSGGRRVSWGAITSVSAKSDRHPFSR